MSIETLTVNNYNTSIPSRGDHYNQEDEWITHTKVSCDGIRKKINCFLATKEMTQTAFLQKIGVNSNSFGRFMKLKGAHGGDQNGTFWGAINFFAAREKADKEAKKANKGSKKRSADEISGGSATADTNVKNKKQIVEDIDAKIKSVTLSDGLICVYDDCDVVRAKIGCIIQSGLPQSQLATMLGMSPGAISKFLSKKGPNQGAGSDVYPKAYKFFEKLRIANNEPKSAHRKMNESKHPQGFPLVNPPTHEWVFCGKL
eukprot:gene15440-20831_t